MMRYYRRPFRYTSTGSNRKNIEQKANSGTQEVQVKHQMAKKANS